MNTITWKTVVGFEGVYDVSSDGRVRRVGRTRGSTVGRILRGLMRYASQRGLLFATQSDQK